MYKEKLKILVIVGTVREGRNGRKVADWYVKEAKKVITDIDFELLDLAEEKLPLFSEAITPLEHQYTTRQQELAAKIASADGFVFVTGEYNHSIPGSLKNFLDYINIEWQHKAAAFVGYGLSGGIRAIEHLIQIMTELRVACIASTFDNIHINQVWAAFDDNGNPKQGYFHGHIEGQLKELSRWSYALRRMRKETHENT